MTGILWAVLQQPLDLYPIAINPIFPEGKPHHITLIFGCEREDWEHLIGKTFVAQAIELCHNDRIQAVRVQLPEWVPCRIDPPHITVSYATGAMPAESADMLKSLNACQVFKRSLSVAIEFLEWKQPD